MRERSDVTDRPDEPVAERAVPTAVTLSEPPPREPRHPDLQLITDFEKSQDPRDTRDR